ncbi:Ig-like domain-containing protein [Cryomorphaceae bacterium 1068]|nr:Ig-like domain-containing protein [Cryomorphaceae bacterium 1068]
MRIFLLFAFVLILGCAKQNSLTGGDKDITPPQVLEYNPPNLSTNFSEKRFELEFDEFIQVKSLAEQLIVSPLLSEPPEYSLKSKTLIIEWEEDLLPNTTYQFNFGSAISDLNESNVNSDLLYVFSTGDLIDSLSISGKVLAAKDNKPLAGASVLLYRGKTDSLPRTTQPDFFALTNSEGFFRLRYLPEGDFKLFVLSEEASNYIYDGPPEIIGFSPYRISSGIADSTETQLIIPAFTEQDTTQFILGTEKKDYGFYQAVFNLPTEKPEIIFKEVESGIILPALNLLNPGRDTLTSWIPLYLKKEPIEEIEVLIQDGDAIQDTSFWYPEIDPKFRQEPKLKITSNLQQKRLDRYEEIKINLSNPLDQLDTTLITILEDSVEIAPRFFKKSVSGLHFFIHLEKKPTSIYQVIMKEGAVKDLYGIYSDSTSFEFKLEEEEYYGDLTVSINDSLIQSEPNPVFEFTNEAGKVLYSEPLAGRNVLIFEKLQPGKYGLRINFDTNDNGEWDTGDYATGTQPEGRLFYPEEIEVRSNWDLEIDWTPAPIPYGVISN